MLILIPFDTDSVLYHLTAYYYMYTFLKSPTIFGVDVKLLVGSEDQKYIQIETCCEKRCKKKSSVIIY